MIRQTWDFLNAKYGWNEEGATAVEYGIMVALIAVAIIVTVGLIGDNLDRLFGEVNTELNDAGGGAGE